MEEPKSRVGWVLAGVGAALFAGLMFYLTNLRWFGTHFLHFDGAITRIQPLGSDRLLVIENVQTGGGEDGPSEVGDRWRIVELASGKVLVGPHYLEPTRWTTVQSDRLLAMTWHDLEVRGFDNQLIANLASWEGVANLRHEANDVTLGEDGGITAMADDGRMFALDVTTLQATLVPARPPSYGLNPISHGSVEGRELKGEPRARVNGKGPDYLEPQWVQDPVTRKPSKAAGGWLMLHHLRVYGQQGRAGPAALGDQRPGRRALAVRGAVRAPADGAPDGRAAGGGGERAGRLRAGLDPGGQPRHRPGSVAAVALAINQGGASALD